MPFRSGLVGYDVDYSSDCIRSEGYRNHSFVDLYAFSKIYRYVVNVECSSGTFLGHSVDEDFYMFPAESVQHQLHVRAYSP